jgi:hypothetical protein|tara:strand:+ start:265 stop:492 length:228 start_codon:yes stop_codon:yes gene_type:complete
MLKDYIFANKNRFKIIEEEKDFYFVNYIKENQIVEEFYIPKQDDEQGVRAAILFWYSGRYLVNIKSHEDKQGVLE